MREFLHGDRWIMLGEAPCDRCEFVFSLRRVPNHDAVLPQIVAMAKAATGIDLLARAFGAGTRVVHDARHPHRTGKRPPGKNNGCRRRYRQPGVPFVPMNQQTAAPPR